MLCNVLGEISPWSSQLIPPLGLLVLVYVLIRPRRRSARYWSAWRRR